MHSAVQRSLRLLKQINPVQLRHAHASSSSKVAATVDTGSAFRGLYQRDAKHPQWSYFQSRPACGDDAFMLHKSDDEVIMAVADGVGGWRQAGVDPGFFSYSLMDHLQESVKQAHNAEDREPLKLLQTAYARLIEQFGDIKKFPASTTVVIARLSLATSPAKLSVCNLGDSACIVLRADKNLGLKCENFLHSDNRVLLRTRDQVIFSMPYQIGPFDEHHRPEHSDQYSAEIGVGDTVLLCSDGVTDNLNLETVAKFLQEPSSAQKVSEDLVQAAVKARRKPDDTTAVVARLLLQDSATN